MHCPTTPPISQDDRITLHLPTPSFLIAGASEVGGSVKTPMPCKISQVLVTPGQIVEKGATLVILEAMKMEVCDQIVLIEFYIVD